MSCHRSRPRPFFPLRWLPAALVVAGLGCGGPAAPHFPERSLRLPAPGQTGAITGVILFEGEEPPRPRISMADAWCRQVHPAGALEQSLVVEKGRLRDVLVHLSQGVEAFIFDYQREPAALDQVGCLFTPRVLAVRAWQPVIFRSQDQTVHNVNTLRSSRGQGFNRTLSGPGDSLLWQFKKPELGLVVLCNIHPWMRATIHVLDHPFFAVTGTDGRYDLIDVPAGRHVLEALHSEAGARQVEIEVRAGETAEVSFTFGRK